MNRSWPVAIGLLIVSLSGAAPVPAPALTDDLQPDDRNIESGIRTVLQNVLPAVKIADGDEGRPSAWFGVRVTPPGPALTYQLGLADRGLLITNICKDSPAQRCGLQQFDVVVSFGGKPIVQQGDLSGQIQKLGPRAKVSVLVLRKAKDLTLKTQLVAWPEFGELEWVYEEAPTVVWRDKIDVGGQILQILPSGDVGFEPLDVQDLPRQFRLLLQGLHPKEVIVWNDGVQSRMKCQTTKGNVVIEVEQATGGPIHVRRITREGQAEETVEEVYADEQALQDGDEEAYDVFQDCSGHLILRGELKLEQLPELGTTWREHNPFEKLKEHYGRNQLDLKTLKEWHDKIGKGLEEIDLGRFEKLEEALRRADERIREADRWIEEYRQLQAKTPQFSFKTQPDGRIIAIIRKGEDLLNKVYESVDDLREKSPKLFERYQQLEASE
ncbi:MAG: PDZ domain-containing protein [Planctomycetes bacterium]|nr:PDZ domain-containing protein [Planctomycetota bacterium]